MKSSQDCITHFISNYTIYIYSLGDAFIQSYIDGVSIFTRKDVKYQGG